MFGAIVVAALAIDGIFCAAGLVPEERPSIDSITERGITWNYTTVAEHRLHARGGRALRA